MTRIVSSSLDDEEAKTSFQFRKLLISVILWPFIGQVIALMIIGPMFMFPIAWYLNGEEGSTTGTITRIQGESDGLARKVFYSYTVDGTNYEGNLQWVNLKERLDIKIGYPIHIYYQIKSPLISRAEGEMTMWETAWATIAMSGGVLLIMLWVASRRAKKARL